MARTTDAKDGASGALAGRTVALPETRELDRLATMLEEQGARALRCPLVAILDAPDPGPVDAWLAALCAGAFDDVVLLTGEGLRRLLARAQRLGTRDDAIAALARVRRITRGPKPARALHEIGLSPDLPARVPTTEGVIETLRQLELRGRRIGLQLYGVDPNLPLQRFLAERGARVHAVAPYVYAAASEEQKVVDLIDAMTTGKVDVLAFTSASQVERLFTVADARGLRERLLVGLGRTKVASIGPVVEAALRERGAAPVIVTAQPFVMKRLVAAIADAVGR